MKLAEIKNLASVGIADIAGAGIAAIFWLYMATLLNSEQYGEIHYFLGIAGLAYAISLIGTQNTIIVFTAKNVNLESTLYLVSLIAAVASALILILIFYRLDVSLILFGFIISELAIGYLLGKKFYINYSKYVLTQKILTLSLGIGFYFLLGTEGIIYGLALSYVHFIIIIFKIFKNSKINFPLFKSRLGFITNNYVYSLSAGFSTQIGKLIIVPLLGFSLLGNYALALQVMAILLIFSNIAFKYLLPQEASGISHKKLKIITILTSIGISILGITLLPLVLPIVFPKYIHVVDAIQIMSLYVIPATITLLYTSKFLGLEKSRIVLTGKLISVATITIGIIILGQMLGMMGLAIAFLLSSTNEAIFLVYNARKIKRE